MHLTIMVSGRPAPQGSKQLGGAGQLLEQSAYLPAWRVAVKVGAYKAYKAAGVSHLALPLFPAGTPVYVRRCVFIVADEQCRAEGTNEPLGTPDIDKLLRATLDALGGQQHGSARLFADDSQVVGIDGLRKVRTTPRAGYDRPGALIHVSDDCWES